MLRRVCEYKAAKNAKWAAQHASTFEGFCNFGEPLDTALTQAQQEGTPLPQGVSFARFTLADNISTMVPIRLSSPQPATLSQEPGKDKDKESKSEDDQPLTKRPQSQGLVCAEASKDGASNAALSASSCQRRCNIGYSPMVELSKGITLGLDDTVYKPSRDYAPMLHFSAEWLYENQEGARSLFFYGQLNLPVLRQPDPPASALGACQPP